ncbi:MAG: hypothetical protein WCC06_02535 [Candidatus Aminicenantales bacterium]
MERFLQELKSAEFCRFHSSLNCPLTGDDDDFRRIRLAFYLFQDFQPIHSRHFDVQ